MTQILVVLHEESLLGMTIMMTSRAKKMTEEATGGLTQESDTYE